MCESPINSLKCLPHWHKRQIFKISGLVPQRVLSFSTAITQLLFYQYLVVSTPIGASYLRVQHQAPLRQQRQRQVDHLAQMEALYISDGDENIQRAWKVIRCNMTILSRESAVLKQQTIWFDKGAQNCEIKWNRITVVAESRHNGWRGYCVVFAPCKNCWTTETSKHALTSRMRSVCSSLLGDGQRANELSGNHVRCFLCGRC
jgi:hypothetical protein